MSRTPLVSVVMATYQWPEALAVSIPCVIAQRYPHWELLVVGDACTDDSRRVALGFGDPRIRWFNLAENSGSQSGPNNLGIREARGELIAYLGHDDLWSADHLERFIECYDGSPDFFASAVVVVFDASATVQGLGALPVDGLMPSSRLWSTSGTPSGILHSRSLAERTGPWRDWRTIDLTPDKEFFRRMALLAGPARRTGRATAAKIPASWRRDIYKRRDVSPQRLIEARLRADPAFLRDAAFVFLASQYPTTFRKLVPVALWRARHVLADLGGRSLRRRVRGWLPRRMVLGAHMRGLRRVRGLEE
jgi:glycosyltransferase involved in cell wall biosynthesis